MNDKDDVVIETDGDGGENDFATSEEDLEASESRAETKLAKLRAELEQAKKEKQENLDGWQRAKADYVNAVKRFEEEKRDAITLGTLKAALAFIPAMASLHRAQETCKKNAQELPQGFGGIAKQLESAAKTLGLEQFGVTGEVFDPALHEALGQDATDSQDHDNLITTVLEPGWKIGDHVLRPAKVKVAHFARA